MWHKIAVPKSIVARPGDAVSYYILDKNGKRTSQHLGAACYAGHMANLSSSIFDCVPCNTKTSILPSEDFFLWMKFCSAFGFAPSGTIPYVNGESNCCIMHGNGDSKHRVYAGLCCYRWAECLSPMVYEACRLIEKRPDINFYRIMHYITGKYVTLMGHSFTNVTAASMSMYNAVGSFGGVKPPRLDHMWGLIPKFFFSLGHNLAGGGEKKKKNSMYAAGYTQTTIATLIQQYKMALPVSKHEDLLDDRWAELYELETTDKDKIKAVYDALIPEKKKAKAA